MLDLVVGVFVAMMIGYLWYSPMVFGSTWCRLAHPGKKPENLSKEGRSMNMCLSFCAVAHFAALCFIGMLQGYLGVMTVLDALKLGSVVAGVVLASEIPHLMFANEPIGLYLINQGHNAAVIMAGSVVMAVL